jgi:hypothetical protein
MRFLRNIMRRSSRTLVHIKQMHRDRYDEMSMMMARAGTSSTQKRSSERAKIRMWDYG